MSDINFTTSKTVLNFSISPGSVTFGGNTGNINFTVSRNNIAFNAKDNKIIFNTHYGGGGGTFNHSLLEERLLPNQHPITAISGLQETISDLAKLEHTHLAIDIIDFDDAVEANSVVADNTAKKHDKLHVWNSITDHSDMPSKFPPEDHLHPHTELTDVNPDDHHNQTHVIDGPDHTGSLSHGALDNIGSDQHHAKSHIHDGIDGSGQVYHDDLLNKHIADQHPHSSIYNIGPNDHHNEIHTHSGVDEGGLIGLEEARLNGNTMLGDIIMSAGSIYASPEGIQLDISGTPPTAETEGQFYWNPDDETVNFVLKDGVVGQIFEEGFSLIKNQTGAPILNGKAVMFAGAIGASGRLKGAYGLANNTVPAIWTLGVATQDIEDGGDGRVTVRGKVRGIDTTGTPYGETWVDGDILYMSATTPGALTKVPPEAPNLQITMAAIVSAHATAGILYIRPTWRGKLVDLDDVNGTPVTVTGQIAVWDNAAQYFDFSHNIIDIEQKIDDHITKVDELIADTQEPNGFNRNDPDSMGVVTFDEVTRLLSISVLGGQSEFSFYSEGVKFTKTATESVTITDVDDKHYIYFDEAGVLQHSMVFDVNYLLKYALVSIVYWNTVTGEAIIYANEQHGIQMDGATHLRRHATTGAAYSSGLNIDGLVAGLPTYTQTTSGIFFDEDIMQEVVAELTHPFFYRLGSTGLWYKTAPDNNAGHDGGGNTYYNEWTGSAWQLTTTTGFVIYHFIATNDTRNVIAKIVGQGTYVNKTIARAAIETEIHQLSLGGLPTPEFIFLYSMIVDSSGDVVALSDGSTFVDFRTGSSVGGSGSSGVSQYHEDLLGITADDHHAQVHAIDGSDHTGLLPYASLSGVPTELADINATEGAKLTGIEAGAEVNNISDVNATDLTDTGNTTLHRHDRYYEESDFQLKSTYANLQLFDGYMAIPKGYSGGAGFEFRFDTSQTNYIMALANGATLTVTKGTPPSAASMANLFTYQESYINLLSYKDINDDFQFELLGISLSNSSNTWWRIYSLFHSSGTSVTNLKVELLSGDGVTWVTAYDAACSDIVAPKSNTHIITGILKGMRFTYSGVTGNAYLKMVGATSLTSSSFAWQMLKSGGAFAGDIWGMNSGIETWRIAQDGLLTAKQLTLSDLAASSIVETSASKQLITITKNTGHNLALGTGAGQVAEGNHDHTDLHTHSNKTQLDLITDGDHDVRTDNPHGVTAAQAGADPSGTASTAISTHESINDHSLLHDHTNKAILAEITAAFQVADETKLDGIEAGAEVNNISDTNATDLTDSGETTLHTHPAGAHTHSSLAASDDNPDPALSMDALGNATFVANVTIDENLAIGTYNDTTESRYIGIGEGRTADGDSYIDLIGDTTYSDYGLRIKRSGGLNGTTQFFHKGTGSLSFQTEHAGHITFATNGTLRGYFNGTTGEFHLQISTVGVNEFSADGTLGGNSDSAVPTEKAVKTYVDNHPVTIENDCTNGEFFHWQRGVYHTVNGGINQYLADRWKEQASSGIDVTISRNTRPSDEITWAPNGYKTMYVHVYAIDAFGGTGAQYARSQHSVLDVKKYAGHRVCVSFILYSTVARNIGINVEQWRTAVNYFGGNSVQEISLVVGWQEVVVFIDIPLIPASLTIDEASHTTFNFWWGGTTDYFTNGVGTGVFYMANVEIYKSSIQLNTRRRSPAEELTRCLPFYENTYDIGVNPGALDYNGTASSVAYQSTEMLGMQFKVKKVVTPAVTLYSPNNGGVNQIRHYGANMTASVGHIGQNGFRVITGTGFNTSIAGAWYHYVAEGDF